MSKTYFSIAARALAGMLSVVISTQVMVSQAQAAPAPKAVSAKYKAGAANACDYASFGHMANGQSFWSSTASSAPSVQMNCFLDQFVMNNFLYLAGKGSGGQPRFMSYAPWYTLFTESGTPSWPGKYSPLSTTELHHHDNQIQAGDGYVLKDVNRQITSYDMRVNQTYFNFVAANSLYKQSSFNNAVTAYKANNKTGGIWFPPASTGDTGEGAVTIKTSWRYYGPMQKKYITQKRYVEISPCPADLMHCERDSKGDFWGLAGLHLVQKTANLPGFVWATFEHVGNVPDCNAGNSMPIGQQPISPATGKAMNLNGRLLNGIGAQTGWNYFNYATYKQAGGDGQNCSYPTAQQANTQCLSAPQDAPVNICRTLALPVASTANCTDSANDPTNMKATSCLNESIKRNFSATGLDKKWLNYRLVGMEWLSFGPTGGGGGPLSGCLAYDEDETTPNDWKTACPNYPPLTPGEYPPSFARAGSSGVLGSPSPANATMETWMQYNMKLNANTGATDCLACHQPQTIGGTDGFGQGDFSHLFGRIKQQ
ncbi:MAG: hypothetical protein M0P59_10500 [Gallionella sp.]|jgi:hypothetical protein|nr:hypothetical protein [Gallionella sp.]MCK9354576.1 hypothetical protein [Gallionella sp.]